MSLCWHLQVTIPAVISSDDGVGLQFSPMLLNQPLFNINPAKKIMRAVDLQIAKGGPLVYCWKAENNLSI